MDGLQWKTLIKVNDLGVSLFSEMPICCMYQNIILQTNNSTKNLPATKTSLFKHPMQANIQAS